MADKHPPKKQNKKFAFIDQVGEDLVARLDWKTPEEFPFWVEPGTTNDDFIQSISEAGAAKAMDFMRKEDVANPFRVGIDHEVLMNEYIKIDVELWRISMLPDLDSDYMKALIFWRACFKSQLKKLNIGYLGTQFSHRQMALNRIKAEMGNNHEKK